MKKLNEVTTKLNKIVEEVNVLKKEELGIINLIHITTLKGIKKGLEVEVTGRKVAITTVENSHKDVVYELNSINVDLGYLREKIENKTNEIKKLKKEQEEIFKE